MLNPESKIQILKRILICIVLYNASIVQNNAIYSWWCFSFLKSCFLFLLKTFITEILQTETINTIFGKSCVTVDVSENTTNVFMVDNGGHLVSIHSAEDSGAEQIWALLARRSVF